MNRPTAGLAIRRGLRRICPRCGQAPLIDPATKKLRDVCPACDLPIARHDAAALPVAYVSTALMNGMVVFGGFVLGMPRTPFGIAGVLALSLGLMLVTAPARRGLGVALDWLSERD